MERCQRIGCSATFSPQDNADGSCRFHPGPPLFHDGGKEWKCCKQRSHDFSLFLEIPGCTTGKHTTEKPQTTFTSRKITNCTPVSQISSLPVTRDACSRCRQGFFCADHGTQPGVNASLIMPKVTKDTEDVKEVQEKPRVIDMNAEQVCKKCQKTFREMDNYDTACNYHPGPPVFHDRSRGWGCCGVHVKEFDEFLEIPPCMKGWHQGS